MVRRSIVVLSFCISGCATGGAEDAPTSDAGAEVNADASGSGDGSLFPMDDAADDAPLPSCNGAPLTAWQAPTPLGVTGVVTSATVVDPYVLPDGLALLFASADASGKSRLHFATRANRSAPFVSGALIPGFEGADWAAIDVGQPTAVGPDEMVFTTPANNGDLWVATRPGGSGSVTSRRYTETFINTADVEGTPTLTADGERMIFARAGSGTPYGLYEATRLTTTPGSAWIGVSALTSLNNASYSVACPALSPDGLTLYFATNSEAPTSASTQVFVTQRTSRTTAFGTPVAVPALSVPGKLNCPRSITADGCELYLSNDSTGTFRAYSAKRAM